MSYPEIRTLETCILSELCAEKNVKLGLPETLKIIQMEKRTKTITARVEPSLALYLKKHGRSTFIHTLILQSLAVAVPDCLGTISFRDNEASGGIRTRDPRLTKAEPHRARLPRHDFSL